MLQSSITLLPLLAFVTIFPLYLIEAFHESVNHQLSLSEQSRPQISTSEPNTGQIRPNIQTECTDANIIDILKEPNT